MITVANARICAPTLLDGRLQIDDRPNKGDDEAGVRP